MRPFLSEFSYGYALTEELASGAFGNLVGAPIFPSLYQEGQEGGGFDLQLPFIGAPLFLQFKLSDCLLTRHAAEWNIFNRSYYRMHIRPSRYSDQQRLLCDLEKTGAEVYYVAPYFHTTEELNQFYAAESVAENSVWFSPLSIGYLQDEEDHYVVFDRYLPDGYFCSRNPRPVKEKLSRAAVAERELRSVKEKGKHIDKEFFSEIADTLLSLSSSSKTPALKYMDTLPFRQKRRSSLWQEAQFAAFISRSMLNAELIIMTEAPLLKL